VRCRHAASSRLRKLAPGWVERTYASGLDGYWADRALEAFAKLEARGLAFESLSFHQNGDGLTYRGPGGRLLLMFAPEYEPPLMDADVALDGIPRALRLDVLLRQRDPRVAPPTMLPLEPQTIDALLQHWATQIERLVPELLAPPT